MLQLQDLFGSFIFFLFVEHLILFLCYFPNFLPLFVYVSLVAHWASLGQLFCLFLGILWISISLGVGYWKFIEFFWLCHISLTFDVSCFLALVSVHLKKSPFPVLIKKLPLSVGVDGSSRFGGETRWCSSWGQTVAMRLWGLVGSSTVTPDLVVSILV